MVQRKTENVVRFTVEINRSTEIRGKRNGVVDIRAREIGSAEDPRIDGRHMVVREARGASTESRKEAIGGHLTKIKIMAEALKAGQNLDDLFTEKPEKLNYCLAPERLEAQARAIKRFEQQDRDEDQQQRKTEKDRRHKLMTAKTRKGQPVMQGRMELLYEKVQKVVGHQG
ncbi:hypothetical protein pipiens_015974 [Culex pipiens pipiens]|uniref:Uncharacterized protein n=1 Tax=Culex pipiens pipiens TaxID=38569 RepID=A0ABD1CN64_CULPP